MEAWIAQTGHYLHSLLGRWQSATANDYTLLILAVAISGWFLTRRSASR